MYALPEESSAMEVYMPTAPELSTVVVVHDWALALPEARRLAMITNRADKIILLFIVQLDRKSTRLNSSHSQISYAVFCLKKIENGPSPPGSLRSAAPPARPPLYPQPV